MPSLIVQSVVVAERERDEREREPEMPLLLLRSAAEEASARWNNATEAYVPGEERKHIHSTHTRHPRDRSDVDACVCVFACVRYYVEEAFFLLERKLPTVCGSEIIISSLLLLFLTTVAVAAVSGVVLTTMASRPVGTYSVKRYAQVTE